MHSSLASFLRLSLHALEDANCSAFQGFLSAPLGLTPPHPTPPWSVNDLSLSWGVLGPFHSSFWWKYKCLHQPPLLEGRKGGRNKEFQRPHTLSISRHFPLELPGCNPFPTAVKRPGGGESLWCRRRELESGPDSATQGFRRFQTASHFGDHRGKINYPVDRLHFTLTINSSLSTSSSMLNS